jgi:hypothetical protein
VSGFRLAANYCRSHTLISFWPRLPHTK